MELDEALLWDGLDAPQAAADELSDGADSPAAGHAPAQGSESGSDSGLDDDAMAQHRKQLGGGHQGMSLSSGEGGRSPVSSNTTAAVPIAASVLPAAAARGIHRPPRRTATMSERVAQSLPAGMGVKMGSSAPINIPMLGRQNLVEDDDDGTTNRIPPHLLSAQGSTNLQRGVSISGISPNASLKREKLQQRNAILRRTGFIEGTPRLRGMGEVMDPIKESAFEPFLQQHPGALSKALGTSPALPPGQEGP